MVENIEKDWTIMVYMAGDNNLSIDMVYALEQIKSAADQNDNINLLAYFDGYSSNVPTLYCDFTDSKSINYYRSFNIKDKLIKRGNDFNENSASIDNVINFVDWCVNKVEYQENGATTNGRKAKNYALIFSGHSFGFQSEGLFKDEKANYSMNLTKLKWMFERLTMPQSDLEKLAEMEQNWADEAWDDERIKERTTEIIGKPLTLLGFDSCVMSMLEVGCQFKKVAETMVASEGSIPNAGWSYTQILLDKIGNDKNATSKEIAASFVENFIRQQNKYALADISVDMAAWDLTALSNLEKSFGNFVQKLLDCFADSESVSYKQLKRILIQVHWQCQTYMYQQNIDLGDFCQLILKEIDSLKNELHPATISTILELERTCQDVLRKIRDCVILTGFSGGNYQFSNGISLFFPWSWSSYQISRNSYEALSFIKKTEAGKLWNQFLIKYLGEISLRKAKPLSSIKNDGTIVKNSDGSIVYRSYEYISETNELVGTGIFDGTKIPENPANKIPENPANKIPENPANKIPENPANKIPENPANKIPENPANKIPENPANKLFSSLDSFFTQFMETRNIESFWNHSGFISKEAKLRIETSEESDSINPDTPNFNVAENIVIEFPFSDKEDEKPDNKSSSNTDSIRSNLDSNSITEAVVKTKKKKKTKKK